MKKYKLKLDYTEEELKELRILGEYDSPMNAIWLVVEAGSSNNKFINLREKYIAMEYEDEFDFIEDISNVIMGTAIFPEKKYVVHDKVTGQYIYYNVTGWSLCWGRFDVTIGMPEKMTKEEWLKISPAYEAMLEKVED